MTDFHLIPAASAAGTLRGFPSGKIFRHAEGFPLRENACTPHSGGSLPLALDGPIGPRAPERWFFLLNIFDIMGPVMVGPIPAAR